MDDSLLLIESSKMPNMPPKNTTFAHFAGTLNRRPDAGMKVPEAKHVNQWYSGARFQWYDRW
jgi:hypothetical protein